MCQRLIYFRKIFFLLAIIFCARMFSFSQTFQVMSRCGGSNSVSLPSFNDNDMDGLSDTLENLLLQHFVPTFIQFSDEGCPGLSVGTSAITDTNLTVCRIFPLFQQYTAGNNVSEIQSWPQAIVNERCLTTGLTWYENQIVIYGAVLYGKDCGLSGHTADVEAFSVLLKYKGNADDISWRSDTTLANWEGVTIQTISHASTFCEIVETYPYKSISSPTGKDTVFISPDKHGNYLTIPGCNSSFFCNPGCNNTPFVKSVTVINVGEEAAPFVTDLGLYYSGYAGENPWSDTNFLGGGAGTIKAKLLSAWRSSFVGGQTITTCNDICAIYDSCYSCGTAQYNACINACQSISLGQAGCNNPTFDCNVDVAESFVENNYIKVYPNPFQSFIKVVIDGNKEEYCLTLTNTLGQIVKEYTSNTAQIIIKTDELLPGPYLLKMNSNATFYKKCIILSR